MAKSRASFWLLMSLIPTVLAMVVAMTVGIISIESAAGDSTVVSTVTALIFVLASLYGVCALSVGIILRVLSGVESRKRFNEAHHYAEMNGWHPISKTAWRSMKKGGASLSVAQAFDKRGSILTINMDGETVTVDEFERSLWGLQFGDWLWGELAGQSVSPTVVREKKLEWDQSMALAIRR